jgi:RelA/SpoT family (p)ppGpp synthetase
MTHTVSPTGSETTAQDAEPVTAGEDRAEEAAGAPEPHSRFLISDLCTYLETYLPPEQVREVYRAYLFAAEAHEGQTRSSGEPYVFHPLAVARILAELNMDAGTIVASILHDVIEDTGTSKEQLAEVFGDEVADLVDGVSKLTQIQFESKAHAQAENFRKMMLAMVEDIRVIIIKLADRLHNMRTLGALKPEKRRRIARETLDIYAPVANRVGMNHIRNELEDLGFAALYPLRYRILAESVRKARGNRKEILNNIETAIRRRLQQEQLPGRVSSREKHLYSIYKKMRQKTLSFKDVLDVYAFRIVVDKVDTCYRVLGAMHNLYKPKPGSFKDYIAIPKANGYQSLHTILFGPHGVPIEIQIRSEDMDRVAESGVAAHWRYKSEGGASNRAQARAREWLSDLLEMQKQAGNSLEFLENVKVDLFPDEVYVFSPKGEIMELPRGATAVDFAYKVHTDVGNRCVAAKIDRRLAPLATPLGNGQTVEIITSSGGRPNPAWLNFVVTGKARANIRHYLKNLKRNEAIALGRRMLDKALGEFGLALDRLSPERVVPVLEEFRLETLDDLLEAIGLGDRMCTLVAQRLVLTDAEQDVEVREDQPRVRPLTIKGTEGMVVQFGRCCRPIPGDHIVGFVSAGRGIVVHVQTCRNVRRGTEQWLEVEWAADVEGEFLADLRVDVANRRGVLATVAAAIAEMDSNIENVNIEERDGKTSALLFTVAVRDRKHLADIMRRIRALRSVMRITRMKG